MKNMKPRLLQIIFVLSFTTVNALATVHYVNLNSTNPVVPYTSWATAATNIQMAVNVSASGDEVLVTNGIYQTGTRTLYGNNRVAVDGLRLVIESVNGPGVTVIEGYQVPGTTNGSTALRCVALQDSSLLAGFTLTGGATETTGTPYGGGVYCDFPLDVVSNCIITGNSASSGGGGAYGGTLVNCIISGNFSPLGGGGADNSILINCLVVSNFSGYIGGAAANSRLYNCTMAGNTGQHDSLDNCKVYNSICYYNLPDNGGGVGDGNAFTNDCTIPVPLSGASIVTNAPLFVSMSAGNFQLLSWSPCINAGDNNFLTNIVYGGLTVDNWDLTGSPRIIGGTVDLGAYEFQGSRFVSLTSTNPVSPYSMWSTAATNIQDAIDAASPRDLIVVTDGVYQVGGRTINGYAVTNRVVIDQAVTVQSVNGPGVTIIAGLPGTGSFASSGYRCVYLTNGAMLSGFTLTNGATFGVNPQTELSGAAAWCESSSAIISNCVLTHSYAPEYGGGTYQGTLDNCLISNNTAFLDGGGTYLANLNSCTVYSNKLVQGFGGGGAAYGILSNCVITANRGSAGGGGASFSTLTDCVVSNNFASLGGGLFECFATGSLISSNISNEGGGVYSNVLNNCVLQDNYASNEGGGAYGSALVNCTIVSNSAPQVTGIIFCEATNCIVYDNLSSGLHVNWTGSFLSYCDTTPLPPGFGNITNDPAFANFAAGNYQLQSDSPCINSGNNAVVASATDFAGNPRTVGGTVDMGAYEYQTPSSIISYAWLEQYGLPIDGTADFEDLDGTPYNVYQDWVAGLNPTNPASVLAMLPPPAANNAAGVTVSWQSVNGIVYFIQRGSSLTAPPAFSTIQSNIVGQAGTTSYTDTNAIGSGPYFYRVGVQ
jgi:hypothetical protein